MYLFKNWNLKHKKLCLWRLQTTWKVLYFPFFLQDLVNVRTWSIVFHIMKTSFIIDNEQRRFNPTWMHAFQKHNSQPIMSAWEFDRHPSSATNLSHHAAMMMMTVDDERVSRSARIAESAQIQKRRWLFGSRANAGERHEVVGWWIRRWMCTTAHFVDQPLGFVFAPTFPYIDDIRFSEAFHGFWNFLF